MDTLTGRNIIVTGGNGYLGHFLVDALKKENARVFILDKNGEKNLGFYHVDITQKKDITEAIHTIQPDYIFHLAASLDRQRNFDNFEKIEAVNFHGTYNLLNALKDINYKKLIFTSTSEIYGDNSSPFHEKQIPDPASPYSLTKTSAENLVRTFSKLYNKNYTIMRLFNFFGRNMPQQFFIPQLIHALKHENSFDMTKGEQIRDFLYVDDVITALIKGAKDTQHNNQTYNVCSGKGTTLKELVTTIKEVLNSNCAINFGALPYRKNEIWNMVGDNTKIKQHLGFSPQYNLKQALKQVIQ